MQTNWKDNDTFKIKDSLGLLIQIQDRYNVDNIFLNNRVAQKLAWIQSDLNNARDRQQSMYITFFSLQALPPFLSV